MSLYKLSKSYFDIKSDFFHARNIPSPKYKAILVIKILSLATLIIPTGVGIVYGISKHFHNLKVIKDGKEILAKLDSGNSRLQPSHIRKVNSATKILLSKGKKEEAAQLNIRLQTHINKYGPIDHFVNSLNEV